MTHHEMADQVPKVVRAISPHLAGLHPAVQGAVLADLVATHFAGFLGTTPEIRESFIADWIKAMRELIEPNEAMLRARYGLTRGGEADAH